MPKVTVLMPVYNGELFLREAMESILNQTFHDFEFLIIDDGSTDQSAAIVGSYSDPRIRFFSNGANHGLIFTLNKGLDLAQGEYIARMDCDDFSFPDRLVRQVEFMNHYPEIGLCGTAMKYMNSEIWVNHPTDHEDIKAALLFYCSLNHPTVMLRSEVVKSYSLYYDYEYPHTEDFELWTRMTQITRVTNIPDVLLHYRIHGEQVSAKHSAVQQLVGRKIAYNQLIRMGFLPTEDELNLHMEVCERRFKATNEFVKSVESWFGKLRAKNNETNVYTQQSLDHVLSFYLNDAIGFYLLNKPVVIRRVKKRVRRLVGKGSAKRRNKERGKRTRGSVKVRKFVKPAASKPAASKHAGRSKLRQK